MSECWMVEPEKKTSFAWRRRSRTTEADCRHADLRIASGTVCDKVKREKKRAQGGYIQQRERGRAGGREIE